MPNLPVTMRLEFKTEATASSSALKAYHILLLAVRMSSGWVFYKPVCITSGGKVIT